MFAENVGRTAGGAYAGASAGYGTGASTAIGGSVDEFGQSGGHGSEAHINGLSTKTVQLSQFPQGPQNQQVIYFLTLDIFIHCCIQRNVT